MAEIHELNSLADLDSLRADWRQLLQATPGFSVFQSLEWLEATWDHYPRPQKLRVLAIESGGQLAGIIPFCVRHEHRKIGAIRVLTYPLNDWGTFYGPIGPRPHELIGPAIRHLAATHRDWDVIDLRWADEAAGDFLATGEAFRAAGWSFRARPRMEVRLCRMEGGWDAYVASRSRNWRRQIRRDVERLEEVGEVGYIRYRPPAAAASHPSACGSAPSATSECDEIFAICERIAARSWQAADPAQSTLCCPRVRDQLLAVHRRAAALGMLDTNILTVAGEPVAFNYNYLAEGRTYGLRSGIDQTAGLENCGKVLIYHMLEDAVRRGDSEYSFGPGRQPYKDRYATEMRHAYSFRHYARLSLRSQLLNLRERVEAKLHTAEEVVERNLIV